MKSCSGKHDFKEALQDVGLRVTSGRLSVLTSLHQRGAQSADELSSTSDLDRVTAYRALKQLASAGILVPAPHSEGALRYELADHHTERITCTKCGVSETLPDCGLKKAHVRVLKGAHSFKEVRAHSVEFFGICNTCVLV